MKIGFIGLGGTISMRQEGSGLQPSQSVGDLLSGLLGPEAAVELVTCDLGLGPSASLRFSDLEVLQQKILVMRAEGCEGFVVLQGTDTLEEVSFALELLLAPDFPLVFSGAMRGASHASADGPGNVLAAVQVAQGGRPGVFVVMNDEVHAARYVRKGHTTSVAAFTSGGRPRAGRVHEGRFVSSGVTFTNLERIDVTPTDDMPKVALLKLAFGDETTLLQAVGTAGYSGCILEAMGAGHVASDMVPAIEALAAQMPVVLCSRVERGAVCTSTYGYAGSESDLLARGVLSGGALGSLKAKLLLTFCLAADKTGDTSSVDRFNDNCARI